MSVSIKPESGDGRSAILVATPYHPDFPAAARALGGRWQPVNRTWTFDARDESDVRALCVRIFGTDGSPVELVDVEITLTSLSDAQVYAFGRQLARRQHRDAPVLMGEGVRLLVGSFPARAGSAKYPALAGYGTSVTLLVRDVPRSLVTESDTVRIR